MQIDMRRLMELPDAELIALWNAQESTESGSSPEQDALAAEIERRGLDV